MKIIDKLYGKWLRFRNNTAKEAVKILYRSIDTGWKYRCPDCNFNSRNDLVFQEHIEAAHGYPKDIDIEKYSAELIIPAYKEPAKPSAEFKSYLDILNRCTINNNLR